MIAVDVPEECMPPKGDRDRVRAAAAKRARKAAKRLAETAKRRLARARDGRTADGASEVRK